MLQQIEEEEKEREIKRKTFESMIAKQSCEQKPPTEAKSKECTEEVESKYNFLQQRVACEEEKLMRLKDQYECYKRELEDVKGKKENLKVSYTAQIPKFGKPGP